MRVFIKAFDERLVELLTSPNNNLFSLDPTFETWSQWTCNGDAKLE